MIETKNKILKELAELEAKAIDLKANCLQPAQQTDLEVAILTEQVRILRQKNESASELINKAMNLIKNLT